MKIDTFVSAIRNTFPIESSTKQTQTSEQPRKMAQTQTTEQLSSSTPNSDTDSVYNTESDSNDAAHLPRPHPRPSKALHAKQISTNQRKQPTPTHPNPTPDVKPQQKSPLLPTPPAHYRRSTSPRSSASTNSSRNSTFSRPSTVISRPTPTNNYRFHQNSYISRPYTPAFNNQRPPLLPRPSYQHQNFITRPHQQHQQALEHFFTRPCQQNQQPVYNIHISLPYYTS